MRWIVVLLGAAACGAADRPHPADGEPIDTAPAGPTCAGFGAPCEALPPRPAEVVCGAALREAVAAGLPIPWPHHLSDMGCFDSLLPILPSGGVVPYDVAAPLFSDGSDKGRYIVLPPATTITPAADEPWAFPDGALLLKVFALDLEVDGARAPRPLEIRAMLQAPDGWQFATYAWDEAGADLLRLDEAGRFVTFQLAPPEGGPLTWYYPSQDGCLTCHRVDAEKVIGVRTRQLHHRTDYGAMIADQLVALDAIGMFAPSIATLGDLPRIADPYDGSATTEERARAWLHGNCAHCHQPGGFAPPDLLLDLRITTPFADTATCRVPRQSGVMTTGEHVIEPGDAAASALVQRIRTPSFEKMPPDGATRLDERGIAAIEAWINGMAGCP